MTTDEFLQRLTGHAAANTQAALLTPTGAWTYTELLAAVRERAALLRASGVKLLTTQMHNGAEWIVTDLAALLAGIVHVPLPMFFSPAQTAAVLAATRADGLIAIADEATEIPAGFTVSQSLAPGLMFYRRSASPCEVPAGTAKITFTSGSTGDPKGVCLDAKTMLAVAASLAHAIARVDPRLHVNVLPFPVLLENVAGLYAPLLLGATCIVPDPADTGLQGSSRFDPAALQRTLTHHSAHSLILLPQMLRAYVDLLSTQALAAPRSLRLVAVGGAPVGAPLLARAHALGIPACEGYGLSEAASVQTLNLPDDHCPGSVGKPLPHAGVRIAADGEIEIRGGLFLGYLGGPQRTGEWLATGDLGRIDQNGFLHIHGRKKNLLITAFGRNVSPEWIETLLHAEPGILRAVVLGDDQPALGAVLWPATDISDAGLTAIVHKINASLPDYARIGRWLRARAAFSEHSGMATANGRPRRRQIADAHPQLFQDTHTQPASLDT
jgi:long-subunit acyl-CoA synthetase (AMP-forming)